MNKQRGLFWWVGAVVVLALLAGFWIGRQGGDSAHDHADDGEPAAGREQATVWTCSMHPQVRQPDPGDCPICGMDLIPLTDDADDDDSDLPRLSVSERSAALMNIQTWPAERREIEVTRDLLGRVVYDETRTFEVSVLSESRIERLFVNYTHVPVREGEHIAELYSPEVYAASQELISVAVTTRNGGMRDRMFEDARQRLRLLGVPEREIDRVIESGEPLTTYTLFSGRDGVLTQLDRREGDWLSRGGRLARLVDTSSMWVILDAYERDLSLLGFGQKVRLTFEGLPGEEREGVIAFIPPELDGERRTFAVRVNLPNPRRDLRQGMFARARVSVSIDDRGRPYLPELEGRWISPMHPEIVKDEPGECDVCGMDLIPAEALGHAPPEEHTAPLLIPRSAPLITGRRALVYVKLPDTERPTFEAREIELGPRAGESYVVLNGDLREGDLVVVHGNFKIDSELQIRGRPSMMAPRPDESAPEADDEAIDYLEPPEPGEFAANVPDSFAEEIVPLVRGYLDMATGLAADEFEAAREGLTALHEALLEIGEHRLDGDAHVAWMERYQAIHEIAHRMEDAEDLEGLRAHLQEMTREIEKVAVSFGAGQLPTLYRVYCPMAHDDEGATWLQDHDTVDNAYFGSMMLRCGEVLGEL